VSPDDALCESCGAAVLTLGNTQRGACLAPFVYGGVVREALLDLKFGGERTCVPYFADALAQYVREETRSFDCLCAVPLHPARQKSRGFNQSDLLADALAARLSLPVQSDLLARLRDTPSQRTLDHAGRQENVQGAFAVPPGAVVQGLRILLVDDITTTGATLREASGMLRQAGAARVQCIAVATTVPKNARS
jgi:ComF family protein